MHVAASKGKRALGVVEALLGAGGDPNIRDRYGKTPLHVSQPRRWENEHIYVGTVKLLLQADASVTQQDNQGRTPYHEAIRKGNIKIVRLLALSDVDKVNGVRGFNILDRKGRTATAMAKELAGYPSKMTPDLPKYRKVRINCSDHEKKEWEKSNSPSWSPLLRIYKLIPTIGKCPKKTKYKSKSGKILDPDKVEKITEGVEHFFVSKLDRSEASRKKARHATSPAIFQFLRQVGGTDWTEDYRIEVESFRRELELKQIDLATKKFEFSVKKLERWQKQFEFKERKRQG